MICNSNSIEIVFFYQKKRKFDSDMNDDKFATTLGFISREKCGNKSAILNEKVECCSLSRQHYTHLSDFDEFIVERNPMKRRHLETLKSLANEGLGNSSETLYLICSKNEGMELSQPLNEENHVPRPAIPIGPRFQAEVPEWEGTSNICYDNSDDDLKWLGVELWPMLDFVENKSKVIGEGRHDSCSCEFAGSIDCIKVHISEARELLKLEIGSTFSSWKFDDMGEDVSKSWTLEEQKEFESLVKLNPLSNGKKFWKLATENFPSKSMKCMINYYHNVYIPRRLSMETRSSFDVVDSDNDQDENLNNKNHYSSTGI